MKAKWTIKNNDFLVLRDSNDNIIIPSAEEVFLAQFHNKGQINEVNVIKPSDEITTISFSKFPIDLKLLINPNRESENIVLNINLVINYNGVLKPISNMLVADIDHIIVQNTWYPFVRGSISEINEVLNNSGIEKLGKISLKQYLNIKKQESPVVVDNTQNIPLDKNQFLSKLTVEIPLFVGELYSYQNQGYRWLKMIVKENAGCILADEMGLGKTAQIIAVLASEASSKPESPSLVVAPVSLLENWRREVQKFAPSLSPYIHQGNNRTGYYSEFNRYDLIITSYETILRDLSMFQMINWNIVIADEAQAIKNPLAKRTNALKQITRKSTIAVTGTPVENRLVDLWSLTDFVFPDYLGDLKQFNETFPDEVDGAEKLEPLVSPILLRRRVQDVAEDLPSRIEIPQVLKFSHEEANQYETLRTQIIEEYGKQASLVSLIKLRMFCAHPFLQLSNYNNDPSIFGKYQRLLEILEEILFSNEKVIIFTSYTKMSDVLVKDLAIRFGIHCGFIDGRVPVTERQSRIDKFSEIEGSAILILNPRAAGAGLNITAANHVIHYNLEWNPAIEDQASARAHRRGQTRPVSIYRLFYADTVEEVINERLERKREVSNAAVIGTDGKINDNIDLVNALLKSPLTQGGVYE